MDLSTTYLGMRLPHPLMPGASPMVDDLDQVKKLEDAGAAAIVMHSLFEEQVSLEEAHHQKLDSTGHQFGEALSYFPDISYRLAPDEYLEQIRRIKEAVDVPLIASLNGLTPGGWLEHAARMEQAGADALELNVYFLATDRGETGHDVEKRALEMLRDVREHVKIPVAVKLSPFYSSLSHFAAELAGAGADGLVLFNRFYQPDIDVEELEVKRTLELSEPWELRLRLRWLAILSGNVPCSLAASGGVHDALGALKAVMAGAHAVQMVSALLGEGPEHLALVKRQLAEWLEEHEYESLEQAQGSMNLAKSPDPRAYERANYVDILQSWEPPAR
jgi:dihydroorotate dehydrogenase (fumarate)